MASILGRHRPAPSTSATRPGCSPLRERWTTVRSTRHGLQRTGSDRVAMRSAGSRWRFSERCGLSAINEHGAHWIAGNLRLDLASLNKVEMLPWDLRGAGWEPGEQPTEAHLHLFDAAAELTVDRTHGSPSSAGDTRLTSPYGWTARSSTCSAAKSNLCRKSGSTSDSGQPRATSGRPEQWASRRALCRSPVYLM